MTGPEWLAPHPPQSHRNETKLRLEPAPVMWHGPEIGFLHAFRSHPRGGSALGIHFRESILGLGPQSLPSFRFGGTVGCPGAKTVGSSHAEPEKVRLEV